MKSKKIVSLLLTGAMTAALLAAPAQAVDTQPIQVNSYKGSILEVGERSGLIIGPSGTDYTVVRQIVAKGNSGIKRKKREGKDSTKEETAQKEQRDSEMGEK